MTAPSRCTSRTANGAPCRAAVAPGREVCRWHDPSKEAKAKHKAESKRGGLSKAYGALPAVAALADDPPVAALDLTTAEGLKRLLAATMHALTRLPLDVRLATCLGQIATAQRGVLTDADFERRLEALEARQQPGPHLHPTVRARVRG